ncbi:MAG TPA: YqgE/AlgH family protein [Candidatus Dormibacteraeota bacterium]|nr:YqgE/AlgH family protein [Candidatus Dormibacteraeota bacterium]
MSIRPLTGRLLVAQPTLRDPNFDHTVVMVLEHSEDGAIGVVLNRPSEFDVNGALPNWARLATHPAVVFVGGPVVDGGTAICLARARGSTLETAFKPVLPGVGTLDVNQAPETVGETIEEVRLFAGYAGWAGGQLEGEIEAGGWFVVDARPVDGFTTDPLGLWRAVLGRQRGQLAWFANFPTEIHLN